MPSTESERLDATVFAVTNRDLMRLQTALSRMPCSDSVEVSKDFKHMNDLLAYLGELGRAMQSVVRSSRKTENELRNLKETVEGGRQFLRLLGLELKDPE